MMNDADLDRLNGLVQSGIDAGFATSKAIASLESELLDSAIISSDIEFHDCTSERPLPHHLLLCSSSGLSAHMSTLFKRIAGSGAHYNGMFGAGADLARILRHKQAVLSIEKSDSPSDSVVEQVLLCTRVLSSGASAFMPEVITSVRRHLSAIMLNFPVLLHPSILLPTIRSSSGHVEYTSLAGALATSAHGALPRYRHFRTRQEDKAGGVDQGLQERIAAFANHPCVLLAQTRSASRIRQDLTAQSARGRDIKFSKESLVRTLLGTTGPRVEFLASIMELDELAGDKSRGLVRPFWQAIQSESHLVSQLDSIIAASICAAAGTVHVAALQGEFPDSMRAHQPDVGFLTSVLRRHEHLFGANAGESGIGEALLKSVQRRVFLGRQDSLAPAEIEHNTRGVALALDFIGHCDTPKHAAGYLLEACAGSLRPDGNLPRVDTAGAIAFFKAVSDLGGLGDTDDEAIAKLHAVGSSISGEPRPFTDAWVKASDVLATERLMTSVILRASVQSIPLSLVQAPDLEADTSEVAPSTRRRSRAAV